MLTDKHYHTSDLRLFFLFFFNTEYSSKHVQHWFRVQNSENMTLSWIREGCKAVFNTQRAEMSLIKRFSQLGEKKKKEKPCMSGSILTILSCCAHKKHICSPQGLPGCCQGAGPTLEGPLRGQQHGPLCCHSHTHSQHTTVQHSPSFLCFHSLSFNASTLKCQNTVSVNDLFVLFLQNLYSVCACVCLCVCVHLSTA